MKMKDHTPLNPGSLRGPRVPAGALADWFQGGRRGRRPPHARARVLPEPDSNRPPSDLIRPMAKFFYAQRGSKRESLERISLTPINA